MALLLKLVQSFPNVVSSRLWGWGGKPSFSGLQVSDEEHTASGANQRVTSRFCYIASWRVSPHRAAVSIALVCT